MGMKKEINEQHRRGFIYTFIAIVIMSFVLNAVQEKTLNLVYNPFYIFHVPFKVSQFLIPLSGIFYLYVVYIKVNNNQNSEFQYWLLFLSVFIFIQNFTSRSEMLQERKILGIKILKGKFLYNMYFSLVLAGCIFDNIRGGILRFNYTLRVGLLPYLSSLRTEIMSASFFMLIRMLRMSSILYLFYKLTLGLVLKRIIRSLDDSGRYAVLIFLGHMFKSLIPILTYMVYINIIEKCYVYNISLQKAIKEDEDIQKMSIEELRFYIFQLTKMYFYDKSKCMHFVSSDRKIKIYTEYVKTELNCIANILKSMQNEYVKVLTAGKGFIPYVGLRSRAALQRTSREAEVKKLGYIDEIRLKSKFEVAMKRENIEFQYVLGNLKNVVRLISYVRKTYGANRQTRDCFRNDTGVLLHYIIEKIKKMEKNYMLDLEASFFTNLYKM